VSTLALDISISLDGLYLLGTSTCSMPSSVVASILSTIRGITPALQVCQDLDRILSRAARSGPGAGPADAVTARVCRASLDAWPPAWKRGWLDHATPVPPVDDARGGQR
jgi:hypothetical protein